MLEVMERPVVSDETSDTVSAEEAARILGVSRSTLQRFVDDGIITPLQDRNPLLKRRPPLQFKREDVERLKQA